MNDAHCRAETDYGSHPRCSEGLHCCVAGRSPSVPARAGSCGGRTHTLSWVLQRLGSIGSAQSALGPPCVFQEMAVVVSRQPANGFRSAEPA